MEDLPTRKPRAVTEELRQSIYNDLSPEIDEINNLDLRRKFTIAFVIFKRVRNYWHKSWPALRKLSIKRLS